MDLEKTHDMNVIKNCLKDAGLLEENMDAKVMLEYYNVIKDSECTASEEDETRKHKSQPDECKTSDIDILHDTSMEFETLNEEEPNHTYSYEEIEVVSFCDMPAISEKMLEIIHHEPKYHSALNFNSGSYKKLNLRQKVSLLYKYHSDLNKKIAAFAKRSIYPTPRGKDIVASNKFSGSLLKNSFDINDNSDGSIYTSRSGRQMKRKKYTDDLDFDDELQDDFSENKKIKEGDNEWHMKRTRSADKKNASLNINNNNNNNEVSKSTLKKESQENTEILIDTQSETKRDYSSPISRRLKKLSNEEIMKRSSLFSPTVVKKTRAESMFDKLREEEQKKNLQEREIEIFKESLKDVDPEDTLENNENESQVSDISSINHKKSTASRRIISSRKRLTSGELETNVSEPGKKTARTASKTGASSSLSKSSAFTKEGNAKSPLNDKKTSKSNDMNKIECPLCGDEFPEEDIQEHAATCCDPSENTQIVLRGSTRN